MGMFRVVNLICCAWLLLSVEPLFAKSKDSSSVMALYLTWKKQPDTTMTICWITSSPEEGKQPLKYALDGTSQWHHTQCTSIRLPEQTTYCLNEAELTGLAPDSVYSFALPGETAVYRFKTLSSTLEQRSVKFAVGGDLYQSDLYSLERMHHHVAAQDPDFALVGGDLAYACSRYQWWRVFGLGKESCSRWISWLHAWQTCMVSSRGYLIPMIPCIGNHDTAGRVHQTPKQAPFFYTLFPMPGPQGYNVLDFGNYMSLFILDSAHTHPVEGAQAGWLNEALRLRQKKSHKFAIYHMGAYPSIRDYNGVVPTQIRRAWVPSFEQFGLDLAFEHHDHAYKRTFPIKANQIDSKGVVYLGDGAWGAEKTRHPGQRWYLEKASSTQHVNLVTISESGRRVEALDVSGVVFDSFEQKIRHR